MSAETPAVTAEARAWSRPAGAAAAVLVGGRWLVLLGWVALAVLAVLRLPALSAGGGGLGDVTSADNPALVTETQDARDFGFPLLSRVLVVQHDAAGLPQSALDAAAAHAKAVAQADGKGLVAAAIPVPADARLPAVHRPGTTIVTFLYPLQGQGFDSATRSARGYAAQFAAADRVVGVTGTVPARADQVHIVDGSLRLLEAVSLAAVLLIVGVAFRSLVAPLLTLAVAGLSFVLVLRVSGYLVAHRGWDIPADLEPLMVALLLGVTTDYVVYFLSGLRGELAAGHPRVVAARRTTATFAPIVAVAGVTISAGVASLVVAKAPAVRAFGPAMALTVLISVAVAVTVVPAAMGVLGRAALWPSSVGRGTGASLGGRIRRGTVRVLRYRVGALVVAVLCLAGLALAAGPLRQLEVGLPFVAALPADHEAARAAAAAADGFAPGITSPTLVSLRGAGGTQDGLERLEGLLSKQPHVAGVLGPREDAAVSAAAGRSASVFVRPDLTAARYLVVLDADPLDATAVQAVDRLGAALPGLLAQAGLPSSVRAGLGGDTAAVASVIDQSNRDLTAILVTALIVNLVILVLFLRAIVAPLFLLACTVLSAAATLGLTVLVFQERLGHPGITFFVPLAAGVLLVALGSDYNLFAVGHIWEEARRLPLRDAMLAALPRSSAAITTAGIALAASLGTLALVPLRQFQELAFALVVGILIDALVVRTLLVPSLLTLFGRASGWPGRRLSRRQPVPAPPPGPGPPAPGPPAPSAVPNPPEPVAGS